MQATPPTARVSGLWIYPVKGMRGHSVPAAELDSAGFVYDRRYMVVDSANRFVTQRNLPALATCVPHVTMPAGALVEGINSSPAVQVAPPGTVRQALVLAVEALPANGLSDVLPLSVPLVTRADLTEPAGAAATDAPPWPPAGACLRDVVVWESTVDGCVDQGDAAAQWLCAVLGRAGLRLVYFDAGGGCVRAISSSRAPTPASGFSAEVSFADGFPRAWQGRGDEAPCPRA